MRTDGPTRTGPIRSDRPDCVPPDTFADLCSDDRNLAPLHDDGDGFGPLADDPWSAAPEPATGDPLEAFCDAWGAAGISPATAPLRR